MPAAGADPLVAVRIVAAVKEEADDRRIGAAGRFTASGLSMLWYVAPATPTLNRWPTYCEAQWAGSSPQR